MVRTEVGAKYVGVVHGLGRTPLKEAIESARQAEPLEIVIGTTAVPRPRRPRPR
jgi:hypothetical protein